MVEYLLTPLPRFDPWQSLPLPVQAVLSPACAGGSLRLPWLVPQKKNLLLGINFQERANFVILEGLSLLSVGLPALLPLISTGPYLTSSDLLCPSIDHAVGWYPKK